MIRCREIGRADLAAVADLLTRGFEGRSRDYWMEGLRRASLREVPDGFPRFGYMLDHEGTPVGVLLLIYTAGDDGAGTRSASMFPAGLWNPGSATMRRC